MIETENKRIEYSRWRFRNRGLSFEDVKKGLKTWSLWALIIANLTPVFGTLFLQWDLSNLIQLYWLENIVFTFYFLLKLLKVLSIQPKTGLSFTGLSGQEGYSRFVPNNFFIKAAIILYFIGSLVGAIALHGVFVFGFFGPFAFANLSGLLVFLVPLFFSHGISYVQNFIGKNEYEKTSIGKLFLAPYKRIIILHLVVILGAALQNSWILLICIKIITDAFSHLKEHRDDDIVLPGTKQ